jgi:hypothetical protein
MRAGHVLGLLLAVGACSTQTFSPPSLVESVRVLATSADKPYAAPGDIVNIQVLAVDGRPSKPQPMAISWVAQPCIDPANDEYYACYASFAGSFQAGVDLTPKLVSGTAFSFTMPSDVITSHRGNRGGEPYGLAVIFTFACAGHVEYEPPSAGAPPTTVPFGCFDADGTRLGTDAFVFAYSFVYAFADRTNANPVVEGIMLGGSSVDPDAGISLPHCTASNIDDCPTSSLGVVVPPSSDEVDPGNLDANGHLLKEQLYVDYYLTAGKVTDDTIILYDPHVGALSNSSDSLYAPQTVGDFALWGVVHDNRGGVAWQQVPLHTR